MSLPKVEDGRVVERTERVERLLDDETRRLPTDESELAALVERAEELAAKYGFRTFEDVSDELLRTYPVLWEPWDRRACAYVRGIDQDLRWKQMHIDWERKHAHTCRNSAEQARKLTDLVGGK